MALQPGDAADTATDVFDVAHWIDRAQGRAPATAAAAVATASPAAAAYVPRHRADVPVDSVA